MPNRDGAAADVASFYGNTEAILAIEHLHRKGFVQFPEPDVIDAEAEPLEQLGNREHRADPHFIRFSASGSHADVASERLKAPLGGETSLHADHSRGPAGQLRHIPGGDHPAAEARLVVRTAAWAR